MSPNPIHKVLSTLRSHGVRHLLMGGQACVFYGAAEFSRDTDILLLAEPENLERLSQALEELRAECIAVPPFSADYLKRGHAVHFRCRHPEAAGMRIDVMSVLRGVDTFEKLWQRRTTVEIAPSEQYDLVSLPDLVQAKKTQRDKDWPMIRRLVEAHKVQNSDNPTRARIDFWLTESRTVSDLLELADGYPAILAENTARRPLLSLAATGDEEGLAAALAQEEQQQRRADREYWEPLKAELAELRRKRP